MSAVLPANPLSHPDRDVRQREIVPPQKLAACHAIVIGVGAIGRQVAIQLAAVGVGAMELIDFDTVDPENLAPQAYWEKDLGRLKVEATADVCRELHPQMKVEIHAERFRRSSVKTIAAFDDRRGDQKLAVFACVDSIETRRLIWQTLQPRIDFWADGRMSAEVLRVLTSDSPASDNHYATTLFSEAQAYAGSCTAKSTVYTASIAAGLMLSQFTRWLRELPIDRDVTLNLLSMEMAEA
jgi:sulfur carrier protein ThiS adenylyltransferase